MCGDDDGDETMSCKTIYWQLCSRFENVWTSCQSIRSHQLAFAGAGAKQASLAGLEQIQIGGLGEAQHFRHRGPFSIEVMGYEAAKCLRSRIAAPSIFLALRQLGFALDGFEHSHKEAAKRSTLYLNIRQ